MDAESGGDKKIDRLSLRYQQIKSNSWATEGKGSLFRS